MRWRTETEVVDGKGQFVCGEKRCSERDDLRTWEVNFKYEEQAETKNTLVKLRLCPTCSDMLNFRQKRKEIRRRKKRKRSAKEKRDSSRRKEKVGKDDSSSSESSSSSVSESRGSKSGCKQKRKRSPDRDSGQRFLDNFWNQMMR